jgi:hypothetical protein
MNFVVVEKPTFVFAKSATFLANFPALRIYPGRKTKLKIPIGLLAMLHTDILSVDSYWTQSWLISFI